MAHRACLPFVFPVPSPCPLPPPPLTLERSRRCSLKSAQELWETVLGQLQLQVTKANYQTWLKDTKGLSYEAGIFVVGVPGPFAREWLEKSLYSLIRRALLGLLGQEVEVEFQVAQGPSALRTSCFNPRFTFDTFMVGQCNRLAHAACLQAAERPGATFNPLFIYGPPGLGKTHLLHATGNFSQAKGWGPLLLTAEEYTNEFILSIQQKKTSAFRQKCVSADILLVDDVSFLANKQQTQESLLHTIDYLSSLRHQIVFTADSPPRVLSFLDKRLRSRLEGGLLVGLQPPDSSTRLLILQRKATELALTVPPPVLELVAEETAENVRELEGRLHRLAAYSRLTGLPLSAELASQALAPSIQAPPPPLRVLEAVAHSFNLTRQDLLSRKRSPRISLARHIVIYLLREELGLPLSEIGAALGETAKASVRYGYEKITRQLERDPSFHARLQEIRQKISI
jgi:chromosomal replication initiator protein